MALATRTSLLSVSHGGLHARYNFSHFRLARVPLILLRACKQSELHVSTFTSKSDPVEVIGIGSRKDAVIDYCLSSISVSSSSSTLRFWTIHSRDSSKVQLIQRCNNTDVIIKDLEFPLSLHTLLPPALVLVASTGQDSDNITAIELLNFVKSKGNLAVSIILRPFSFEGRRRQVEADELIRKLQECSNFNIVVEADSLLKTEAETLSEALETANNTVFLSVSMISALTSSGSNILLETSLNEPIREIGISEITKILEKYKEARVGFGAGSDAKSAIKQAIFNTPFLRNNNIKGFNGVIFMTITSSSLLYDKRDLISFLHVFRGLIEFSGKMICLSIYEPKLKPSLIIVTLLIAGREVINEPKKGFEFLSGLASKIPFISSLIMNKKDLHRSPKENISVSSEDAETNSNFENVEKEFVDSDSTLEINEQPNGERETSFWNFGPEFHMAKLWAQERNSSTKTSNKIDGVDVFTLPIGVKTKISDNPESTNGAESKSIHYDNTQNALDGEESSEGSLWTFWEFVKGKNAVESRKQGLLAARAASMLESERKREKMWSPVVKIEYRDGKYKGRCQCGLPEGKGCLSYKDGSFYEGMWRNGKRFGIGTMYYSNGDVFHGTWRDDFMHGKGWYYFTRGDRWFANFWKGKANGEGRFYSQNGNVLFGNFLNGWRHGDFLHVDSHGSRWSEVWDEGVLIKRTKLEK